MTRFRGVALHVALAAGLRFHFHLFFFWLRGASAIGGILKIENLNKEEEELNKIKFVSLRVKASILSWGGYMES